MSKKNSLQIDYLHPRELTYYKRELRTIPEKQISKAMKLLQESGCFPLPIPIGKKNVVLHGQVFVEAARRMGMDAIPVVRFENLNEEQERLIRIALDRIAEDGEWNKQDMAIELQELQIFLNDLTITGFEIEEINLILDLNTDDDPDDDDTPPPRSGPPVTQAGDLWIMGAHKLLCGDSLKKESYEALLGEEKADIAFIDEPYNVKVDGHVGGKGKIKHEEFAMASGEMSSDQFTEFLSTSKKHLAAYCRKGAIIFACMDWRHIREMMDSAQAAQLEMINLICWCKDNAGMGSLYRSQHELVFVFKNGKAKHVNNVQLGSNGRYRTNVWQYPGVNSFGSGRMDELQMHPTVKPTAMVMDALKDCSNRGDIVLDSFGGSGTTLIAADKTGRQARLIELDPLYCDVTVRRWQELTGQNAIHAVTGKTFNETQAEQGDSDNE